MRPVNKGNGNNKNYSEYKYAKDDLKNVLGPYCSYCEMNISNQADIEHVEPQSKNSNLINSWSNWLLACKTCNRMKLNNKNSRIGYIFPDDDNTGFAYTYSIITGYVSLNTLLNNSE